MTQGLHRTQVTHVLVLQCRYTIPVLRSSRMTAVPSGAGMTPVLRSTGMTAMPLRTAEPSSAGMTAVLNGTGMTPGLSWCLFLSSDDRQPFSSPGQKEGPPQASTTPFLLLRTCAIEQNHPNLQQLRNYFASALPFYSPYVVV